MAAKKPINTGALTDKDDLGEPSMSCKNSVCPFSELTVDSGRAGDSEIDCVVAKEVQNVVFKQGEVLFLQGQVSSFLYSMTDGLVKICSHSADGREQIVGLSSPGHGAPSRCTKQQAALVEGASEQDSCTTAVGIKFCTLLQ